MATRAIKLSEIFNEWCYDIDTTNSRWLKKVTAIYGFELRVVVSKDIPPRHSIFSFIRGMGVTKFDEIFQGECRLPEHWLLAFPERHCSVEEMGKLIYQLVKLNREQNGVLKKLDILTSSTWIISDSLPECISIISFKDGKVTYDQDYMSF